MNRLPFELTDKIFDLLSSNDLCTLCLLNHDWHTLASSKLYRFPLLKTARDFDLFIHQTTTTLQNYIQILDLTSVCQYITEIQLSSRNLKHLHLSKCIDLSPCTLLRLIQLNVDHLVTLSLANCTLTSDILHHIGQANHHMLKKLDLSNTMIKPCISIDSSNHLETMLLEPFQEGQLNYLDLSFCTWVDSQTIENISLGLIKLEYLGLQWCNNVKFKSMTRLVQRLDMLKELDIRYMNTISSMQDAFRLLKYSTSLKRITFTSSCTTTTQIEL